MVLTSNSLQVDINQTDNSKYMLWFKKQLNPHLLNSEMKIKLCKPLCDPFYYTVVKHGHFKKAMKKGSQYSKILRNYMAQLMAIVQYMALSGTNRKSFSCIRNKK